MKSSIFIIMGVAGCGKTSVGKQLARMLNAIFYDGDDFHPSENVLKMSQGTPLTDADRFAWLAAINQKIKECINKQQAAIFACSALKEKYRQQLQQGANIQIKWIYLKGDFDTILQRIADRKGHFMPKSLLQSQFDILEEPKYAITLDIQQSIEVIISNIMSKIQLSEFGLVGLGVMGKSLARNFAQKGVKMSLFNRFLAGSEEQVALRFITAFPELEHAQGFEDIEPFVASLEKPRKIFLMIKAGKETDEFIEKLLPFLAPDDIIIDGGNSYFKDTAKRIAYLKTKQINFIGTGVSGGEYGALYGPSIMPSGDKTAYKHIEKYFEAIAAKDKNGKPCCAYIGTEGAGHFIKMVHNGIEYAEMQLIAETYAHLRYVNGLKHEEISAIFSEWADGALKSYLLEITAKILLKKEGDIYLIDEILDKAGNKGTGNWATITASELGMPSTMITAALFARYVSTIKENYSYLKRNQNIKVKKIAINKIKEAYQVARLINHQQGFALMQAASETFQWQLNFKEIARIWTNGCIIRSALMENLSQTLKQYQDLFASPKIMKQTQKQQAALKAFCIASIQADLPIPCHQAAWDYWNSLEARFPTANIIQAQRDFFGAHTYQKVNDTSGAFYHTEWESEM